MSLPEVGDHRLRLSWLHNRGGFPAGRGWRWRLWHHDVLEVAAREGVAGPATASGLATYLPARRAAALDPAEVIRAE